MNDEESEKYLKRIEEQFNKNSQFETPFGNRVLTCFGRVKLKEILEEIHDAGFDYAHELVSQGKL